MGTPVVMATPMATPVATPVAMSATIPGWLVAEARNPEEAYMFALFEAAVVHGPSDEEAVRRTVGNYRSQVTFRVSEKCSAVGTGYPRARRALHVEQRCSNSCP